MTSTVTPTRAPEGTDQSHSHPYSCQHRHRHHPTAPQLPAACPVDAPATTPRPVRPASSSRFPVDVAVGNATQLITVAAPTSAGTEGTLTAWQLSNGSWLRQTGPVHAYLGSEGVGESSEYHSRTPAGTFTLTESFGRGNPTPDPGCPTCT